MKKQDVGGFSSLTEMYSAWMQFDVPVTFYHYFLTLLKMKTKQDQALLMNKEISALRSGSHLYLKIKSSIQARQHSLSIIKQNLPLLGNHTTASSKPLHSNPEQHEFLGYKKLFDTKDSPQQRNQSRQLRQLSNHLAIYRKVTLQIIFLIHKWMTELMSLEYKGGVIKFLYENQDYLEKITGGTMGLLNAYRHTFEFNPFFILRKELINAKHALVYDYLNISSDYAKNLYEGLKLLAEHHANVLRQKMQAQHGLKSSKKKLLKSNSVSQIYGNLLNGKQFKMVKDSYLKQQKQLSKQSSTLETLRIHKNMSQPLKNFSKLQEPPLLINPEHNIQTNFIERKYPTFFSDNTQNEVAKGGKKHNLADYLLQRKYSTNLDTIRKRKNFVEINPFRTESHDKPGNYDLEQQFQTKINNQLYRTRNKLIPKHDDQRKFDLNNILENSQALTESRPLILDRNQSEINIDYPLQRSLDNSYPNFDLKLEFRVEKNIQPTNILRYLRQVFRHQLENGNNLNKMTSQKLQALVKTLLSQRQYITIYKIFKSNTNQNAQSEKKKSSKDLSNLIAWMVCKMYKDASTLQRTVDIIYMYHFQHVTNLQKAIINFFDEFEYRNIKQNGSIVHHSDQSIISSSGTQVIRSKYKISISASSQDLKQIVKENMSLKMSRILKYHYYSKTSKYHKFCEHKSKQGTCAIGYNFSQVSKVFINNKAHVKVKVDSICRIKDCYKVYHHLNNNTFLMVSSTIEDLKKAEKQLQKEHEQEIDRDQSFDKENVQNHCGFTYICFQEGKVMRKFVNEKNKPVINEFAWIQNNLPEVMSIAIDRKDIVGSDTLVLSQPYVLGIYGKDVQQGLKSLAILDFSQ